MLIFFTLPSARNHGELDVPYSRLTPADGFAIGEQPEAVIASDPTELAVHPEGPGQRNQLSLTEPVDQGGDGNG